MRALNEVVITGIGCITPAGDLTMGAGDDGVRLEGEGPFPIEGFKLDTYLSGSKTYLDRCSALALAGTALAIGDAMLQVPVPGEFAPGFGIALGTHLGCLATMKTFWDKIAASGARLANPILFSHSYFNTPISLCAIEFGLKGYHATFCSGQSSGLAAIRAGYDAIRLGHAAAVICGGVEALTPEREFFEPCPRLSEASAFFILEEATLATLRSAPRRLTLNDNLLDVAQAEIGSATARFGACGAAAGALALAGLLG